MGATTDHVQDHGARRRLLAGVPVTERRLELAGVPTAVLEGGAGPPVVLLHSSGEFAALWLRVIPGLAAGHTVVAPDLPGHGASGTPAGPLDAGRMLAWLGELLERTCVAEAAAARHGWPLRVIDGAGDDPPMERPVEFLAALQGRAVR